MKRPGGRSSDSLALDPNCTFSFHGDTLEVLAPGREGRASVVWRSQGDSVLELLRRFATPTSQRQVTTEYEPAARSDVERLLAHFTSAGVLVQSTRTPAARVIPRDIELTSPEFVSVRAASESLLTGTNVAKQHALYEAVRYLVKHRIPGDIVECGVWKGGNAAFMARTLISCGDTSRKLFLYDTFEATWPDPDPEDGGLDGASAADKRKHARHYRALAKAPGAARRRTQQGLTTTAVRRAIVAAGYPSRSLVLVPGFVEETIPGRIPERIALLRLDTDFYRSTLHELEHLYPRLVPGGVLIVDDYPAEKGATEALDRYLAKHRVPMFLHRTGSSGRLGIKPGLVP